MDPVNLDLEERASDITQLMLFPQTWTPSTWIPKNGYLTSTTPLTFLRCAERASWPLLISGPNEGFLGAASKHFMLPISHEQQKLRMIAWQRHVRPHERIKYIPDANYATLKYFCGYLHKCVRPCYRWSTPLTFNWILAAGLWSMKQIIPCLFKILLSFLDK